MVGEESTVVHEQAIVGLVSDEQVEVAVVFDIQQEKVLGGVATDRSVRGVVYERAVGLLQQNGVDALVADEYVGPGITVEVDHFRRIGDAVDRDQRRHVRVVAGAVVIQKCVHRIVLMHAQHVEIRIAVEVPQANVLVIAVSGGYTRQAEHARTVVDQQDVRVELLGEREVDVSIAIHIPLVDVHAQTAE